MEAERTDPRPEHRFCFSFWLAGRLIQAPKELNRQIPPNLKPLAGRNRPIPRRQNGGPNSPEALGPRWAGKKLEHA